MSNKTFKVFVDKMGGNAANTYIGNEGELFYDPQTTTLRMSDGSTPGGIVVSSGTSGSTGEVTFEGVKVIGSGANSGDGNGYSTLELVPDINLYDNDQYIIVDPTVPSHIHLRAGGVQGQSGAELFIGGEEVYLKVNDNTGVAIENTQIRDQYYAYDDSPPGFANCTWFANSGNYFVQYTTTNPTLVAHTNIFPSNQLNELIVSHSGNQQTVLKSAGWSGTVGDVYTIQVDQAPPSSPTSITYFEYRLFSSFSSGFYVQDDKIVAEAHDEIDLVAGKTFKVRTYSTTDSVEITTNDDNDAHTWQFQANGMLVFPHGAPFSVRDTPPTSSVGAAGDLEGMAAYDATYHYYCIANFDGVTNIWRRSAWDGSPSW